MSGNLTQPAAPNDPAVVKFDGPTKLPGWTIRWITDNTYVIETGDNSTCFGVGDHAGLIAAAPDMQSLIREVLIAGDTLSNDEFARKLTDARWFMRARAVMFKADGVKGAS